MREIKFRAWDRKKAIMHRVLKMELGASWIINDTLDTFSEDNTVLMQYTGLKDKNGKEIYEGDIVIPEEYTTEDYPKKYIKDCVVKDLEYAFSNKSAFSIYKVVGNIYENPELLK